MINSSNRFVMTYVYKFKLAIMKDLSKRLLIMSLFLFISTNFIYSQLGPGQPQIDKTTFNLSRRITLKGESEKLEILLPVSGPIVVFETKISSEILEGELTIEIYDPNGEKQGNYSWMTVYGEITVNNTVIK